MNNRINFIYNSLIVEACASNAGLYKNANSNILSSIIGKIKDYFSQHIDPDQPAGDVFRLLTPGVLYFVFGRGWFGMFAGLASSIFGLELENMFENIVNSLKYNVNSGKLTSSQIDNAVSSEISKYNTEPTDEQVNNALKSQSFKNDLKTIGFIKNAKGIKSKLFGRKKSILNIFGSVVAWILKIAFASAGFLVAGDIANKIVNRPSALDNTIEKGESTKVDTTPEQTVTRSVAITNQTKFPVKKSYVDVKHNMGKDVWIESVPNNRTSIKNMLISFAKEVYSGLDNLDNTIASSSNFQKVLNDIVWYNRKSSGDAIVVIPKIFNSKKNIVDHFIDEVAKQA